MQREEHPVRPLIPRNGAARRGCCCGASQAPRADAARWRAGLHAATAPRKSLVRRVADRSGRAGPLAGWRRIRRGRVQSARDRHRGPRGVRRDDQRRQQREPARLERDLGTDYGRCAVSRRTPPARGSTRSRECLARSRSPSFRFSTCSGVRWIARSGRTRGGGCPRFPTSSQRADFPTTQETAPARALPGWWPPRGSLAKRLHIDGEERRLAQRRCGRSLGPSGDHGEDRDDKGDHNGWISRGRPLRRARRRRSIRTSSSLPLGAPCSRRQRRAQKPNDTGWPGRTRLFQLTPSALSTPPLTE